MSSLPPAADAPPPGVPPQQPHWAQPAAAAPRESRGVAFFVAIFLGILLVASAGLNVLLFLLSLGSVAGGGLAGADADGVYDEVRLGGDTAARTKVLSVRLHGAIAESGSPVLGAAGGSVSAVRRALRHAAADDQVRGVLLDIDSPGGGVTDSDEIYRLVRDFRREHPQKRVAALFGDMAASGGYYVAMGAEHVIARRTTITGSIGVIMSAWNFAEAAKKFGVEQVAIRSERTPFKDILSPTRPMRDDERTLLVGIVDELFDQFVDVVDEGRPNLDRQQVLQLATGAIYTAGQAHKSGLVDAIGGLDAALEWFRGQLGEPVELVERRRRPGFSDLLFGGGAAAASAAAAAAPERALGALLQGSTGPRFLYYWSGGR